VSPSRTEQNGEWTPDANFALEFDWENSASFLEHGVLAYVVKPLNDFSFNPVRRKLAQIFPELTRVHPR
jgi:hypothetical protein